MEGCAFANFGNSSGTEGEPSQKREKNGGKKKKIINAAATGNRTRDLSITDQMSVLTNQVHLKIQFRHRFDQKYQFKDSLHRLEITENVLPLIECPATVSLDLDGFLRFTSARYSIPHLNDSFRRIVFLFLLNSSMNVNNAIEFGSNFSIATTIVSLLNNWGDSTAPYNS